ncbi:hypothetical protein SCHIN_v1c05420 [Spiroplasma chinense]|uniref:HTH rpiR-type domain-containing protein n=1 Tax=Spiroplasma chinense TaxID=216932 RepID=A0A5B9Y4X7_9MOLU|nr:hypothetical protein [Spiroplasma chinense]QEH61739.1 hypothetical protein SCHIN_v1c05420 [Spiroplasma chinense]
MISIYERIENLVKDNRNTTFKQIAKQILDDFNVGVFKSQNELADVCYVSMSTITQFAKAALCEGYKELAIRLKIEYENALISSPTQKNINYDKVDTNSMEVLTGWAKDQSDFILQLASEINKVREIWIASSFQSMNVAKHLRDILTNQGIDVKVMDSSINLEVARHVDFTDKLVLVLLTGRDTLTLSRILEFLATLSKNVFIVTTLNHLTELPEVKEWKKSIINYNLSSDYKYRTFALFSLFLLLAEKIDNTPKIK